MIATADHAYFNTYLTRPFKEALSWQDVRAAMEDVNEVVEHIKKIAEQSSWTRSDVGVMCYLFNFMLEIVWNLLLHAAKNQKPMHFSKQVMLSV
jgi:hypothetical protein